MRHLIPVLLILSTAGCLKVSDRHTFISAQVPEETLTPCAISPRKVKTVNELAILATEHLRSAECANGKIETIAEILAKAEPQPSPDS